jgi:hypothetical protein
VDQPERLAHRPRGMKPRSRLPSTDAASIGRIGRIAAHRECREVGLFLHFHRPPPPRVGDRWRADSFLRQRRAIREGGACSARRARQSPRFSSIIWLRFVISAINRRLPQWVCFLYPLSEVLRAVLPGPLVSMFEVGLFLHFRRTCLRARPHACWLLALLATGVPFGWGCLKRRPPSRSRATKEYPLFP